MASSSRSASVAKLATPAAPTFPTPPPNNMNPLGGLMDGTNYSDIEIVCGDRNFPAHKAIVCSRSDWFKKACGSDSKARLFRIHPRETFANKEEACGKFNLGDKDAILLHVVLEFIYKGKYTVDGVALDVCAPANANSPGASLFELRKRKSTDNSDDMPQKRPMLIMADSPVLEDVVPERKEDVNLNAETWTSSWPSLTTCPVSYFHARVYAEADYFMIDELKQYAKREFSFALAACDTTWRLKLLILELWSPRAAYKDLQVTLLRNIMHQSLGGKLNNVFICLDREFIDSVPGFAHDVCWMYIIVQHHVKKNASV
ncbi:uncharacterized protein N7503_001114 [Penicillium pulvis]|uniref:uncharacterized protein n=1 Tax=Penicillium pulvis TaxID=1562058 RepID=UPI0025468EA2|nr:uncharacterized protein N7503_001114 [Penicillium pulvis]KAJ5814364.1 hypothetical protein N7503_001114 [Penicillium pulvis]